MGRSTIDEYYLSEQDESTVHVQLSATSSAQARARAPLASGRNPRRVRRGVRRRLHLLRRAATAAFAA